MEFHLIDMTGTRAQKATEECCQALTKKLDNTVGAIAVSKKGEVGVAFTSSKMPWAYIKGNKLHYGIGQSEKFTEEYTL
jgi:beta-aspartyl-peptidase (threonine type)